MILLFLLVCTYTSIINYNQEFYSNSFSDGDFTSWTIGGASPPTQNIATYCNS